MTRARDLAAFVSNADGDIKFDTDTLFIDSSANRVGIGETAPTTNLHISSTANPAISIEDTDNGFAATTLQVENGGRDLDITVPQDTIFTQGSTEAMRIDDSGNVGIGTSSPAAKFELEDGGTSKTVLMKVTADDSSPYSLIIGNDTYSTSDTDGLAMYVGNSGEGTINMRGTSSSLQFRTVGSERMRIDDSGNVGIGTSSPLRQLHIHDTSANSEIAFTAGTSGVSSILFGDGLTGTDVYRGYLQYNHSNDALLFATSATERMRINSDGSIQMPDVYNDTTASAANLHISSASGLLFRSTSSQRYKNTIQDASFGITEVMALRPVTYKGNNDGDTIFGGLIAEEVHDAGLTEFVQYDDENRPDALAYGNMVSLCIKAIQEQQTTITAQAAKIETLETENTTQATQIADLITRVEALEAE